MMTHKTQSSQRAPRASVIVCVYNRPTQIVACLDSILASDTSDFEAIVVDDGSTDATPDVITNYARQHAHRSIRLVRNNRNRGVSGARNVGAREARGDYILFTDSDCTVAPDWLSRMVGAVADGEAAAGASTVIDTAPTNLAEWAAYGTTRIGQTPWQRRKLVGNNMIFRREILAAHPFDESLVYYCDDDEMAWRLEREGHKITFEPSAVVHHNHGMTIAKYLRQARAQGIGSARYWYKRRMVIGRDLWFLTAAILTLPCLLYSPSLWPIPIGFLALQILALVSNEVIHKGKTIPRAMCVLPLVCMHAAIKAVSVYCTLGCIMLGIDASVRKPSTSQRRAVGQ